MITATRKKARNEKKKFQVQFTFGVNFFSFVLFSVMASSTIVNWQNYHYYNHHHHHHDHHPENIIVVCMYALCIFHCIQWKKNPILFSKICLSVCMCCSYIQVSFIHSLQIQSNWIQLNNKMNKMMKASPNIYTQTQRSEFFFLIYIEMIETELNEWNEMKSVVVLYSIWLVGWLDGWMDWIKTRQSKFVIFFLFISQMIFFNVIIIHMRFFSFFSFLFFFVCLFVCY